MAQQAQLDNTEKKIMGALEDIAGDYKHLDSRWLAIQGAIAAMSAHDEVFRSTIERFLERLAAASEQNVVTLKALAEVLARVDNKTSLTDSRTRGIEIGVSAVHKVVETLAVSKPGRAKRRGAS